MRSTCICLVNDIWTTAVPGLRYCYTDISAIPLKRRSGARYNMYQPRDCWYLVQRCSLVQIAIWVVLQGVTTLSVIPWHTIQCATAGNKTQQHIVWRGIWYALLHLHSEHVDSSSRWRSFQSASISAALASCFSLSSSGMHSVYVTYRLQLGTAHLRWVWGTYLPVFNDRQLDPPCKYNDPGTQNPEYSLRFAGYHDTYYRLQRQAMDSKENGAAVAHTTYSTVYLGNTEPTHRFSSITTTTDYPPSVYCDEPQVMDSCKLAKCHLHRFAASAAVELAPTILPNQSQSVDLQLLQQYSTCRDGHVAGHQFSFCARSTGPTCPQQQSDVITLYCSSSHSATSTASCASESTDTLQGVSALACSGQAHICSGPTAVTAVPASCIGHRHTCMGPCIVRSETMASEQSADTLWDATDSYMQLCNNTAEGSAVITAADSKQQAQQMPWDASRTATTVSTGSTSVQRRLLLTDLAVYPDSSWSSGTALAQANKFMADIRLPGAQQHCYGGKPSASCFHTVGCRMISLHSWAEAAAYRHLSPAAGCCATGNSIYCIARQLLSELLRGIQLRSTAVCCPSAFLESLC